MTHWKFLLLGITGDLSKRKILPALSQFAELNKDKLTIDLIGYSRSQPDKDEVIKILNENSSIKQHCLQEINFEQGDYNNPYFFTQILSQQKESERLIVYLAVPPIVFTDILKIACPYNTKNIEILIEKPFGNNLSEAHQMMRIMSACGLEKNVHFVDHYLFKTATILDSDNLQELKNTTTNELEKVSVKALESIGVNGRGAYYDQIGALKDMLPAHLVSLLLLGLSFGYHKDSATESLKTLSVTDLILGQYESYLEDIGIKESGANTYFKIEGNINLTNLKDKKVKVILESGKKLGKKETLIESNFANGTRILWNIDPGRKVEVYTGNKLIKEISLAKNDYLDHTNIFESILNNDFSRFLSEEEVVNGWEMYGKVVGFSEKEVEKANVRKYKDDFYLMES